MQARFATAVLLGVVLIAAGACSGGGDDERIAELETDLEASEEALERETEARETAEKKADDDAAAAKKKADDDAAATKKRADEQIRQERQKAEAGQRGRGALAALRSVVDGATWEAPDDSATVVINDKDTDIEIVASPLKGATRKSGNFYTATLMRTAPGVNQPERKTVVYSDREKARSFANHYATSIEADVGGTKSNPRFRDLIWAPADSLDLLATATKEKVKTTSRGGHGATIAAGGTAADPKLVNTFSATVHGVSGNYGCYNSSTNAACKISVAVAYDGSTDVRQELTGLTITPEDINDETTALYFDPGGGTISLLNVEKEGVPATPDEEFITFGWWQLTPAKPNAEGGYVYDAAVFATAGGDVFAVEGGIGKAEYEGPAAGLYVDLKSEGGETIYESGDFTATAILRVAFGNNASVEGDVTNFRTTHGAKNWHVKLADDDVATIVQTGASSSGSWTHEFLERHSAAATADNQPIAVTGRFDASIPNVRHIVGAFGAHRTTDPVE